jgi:hypothetical protein
MDTPIYQHYVQVKTHFRGYTLLNNINNVNLFCLRISKDKAGKL